ncbi:MAG: glucosamine-6-phosphate isomerase [Firmicutes bacterium]|nr:glucosamine-6-phosphate isomerase [Bacillota bacterium]
MPEKNAAALSFMNTVKGSMLEGFYPAGWDMDRIDACCAGGPEEIFRRRPHWNEGFQPVSCQNISDFNMMMGHEIAREIQNCRGAGRKLALILPVGPMGMYRWTVYFLKEWNVDCSHVFCFNMDEWSDGDGNTAGPESPGSFQNAMRTALYDPLGVLTVPEGQRNFATRGNLPFYARKIADLRKDGARLATVFGIGRVFHIAFWEPHFAAEFADAEEWKRQTHRLGAKLHPLTVEQNAVTSFKSRTGLVPCTANTIGPGLFLQSDYVIGGCDGAFGRGMQWQGASLRVTLRHGPDIWVPSGFMPTLPGKLFFLSELAEPLEAELN